ncbi:aminobenzoyl-glutamate transporter [Pandoraea terrae]|uniref:Aminobenzoyl-glutamate transporter n=1 Tax=Pandoraea terrae TaxID=1537710 RepID=A0A5E4T9S8_9BURK|nr:AbgT family transporter [Pandoraea terrae]VVD82829.1 aminobenzoyl-glutamate transporter [Pandoraea terrae]
MTTTPRRFPAFQLIHIVERLGNLLPHPVTLFVLMSAVVLAGSAVASWLGVAVADPRPAAGGDVPPMIEVVNLLNAEGLTRILTAMVPNFTGFAPLGTVLVALLGVGVAEKCGLIEACMRRLVLAAPRRWVSPAVIFAAVMSNTAGELGYVVLIPLAAIIFQSCGRHPLAGLAAAFAGVSGGYSANLMLGTVDPLLAGITQASAQLVAPDYSVSAAANWYFMAASTLMITLVGSWVTERVVEPALGPWSSEQAPVPHGDDRDASRAARETRGLMAAGAVFLVCLAAVVAAVWVPGSPLRDAQGELGAKAPLYGAVVALIFLCFLLPALTYGRVTGTMRSDRDVIEAMSSAMTSMGPYIVLVFFAAQFIAWFNWSNLGTILAVTGAQFLHVLDLPAPALFAGFILVCAVLNLMIGSASAQWALTAPVFVPMLMLVGYAPEVIQGAYRIGDSVTNLITPMMSYFGLIVAVAARYRKDIGVGTLMSMMLPYSVAFGIIWSAMFCLWVFALGWPVGPGSETYFQGS